MPVLIRCDCGKPLRVGEHLAGKKVRCPGCQAVVPVPGEEPPRPAPRQRPPAPPAARPRRPAPPPDSESDLDEPERPRARQRPPRRQLVLRIVVLVLSLLGAGVAGFLGFKAYANTHDDLQAASVAMTRALLEEREKANPGDQNLPRWREEVNRFDQLRVVCWFLLAGGLLGVVGGVLALLRFGVLASPLLILPALGAAVFAPITAVLTSPLVLAGLLALLIRRPRRSPAPAEAWA